MKPLKKLHAEAIEKAKTEKDKIKAASVAMIETPMKLIKAILLKHEQAAIEVMRELHEENVKLKNRKWVGLTDEDREILEAVRRELDRGNQDGNAPGHGHEVPGIWDSDNGARAGKPCAWCLTWKKFTTLIDREYTLKDKKK